MGDKTKIEWSEATWNPIRGCRRVSAGCENCYAEQMAHRFSGEGQAYEGLTVLGRKGPRWSGKVMQVPKHLADPMRWTRPRRIFVNSMSDLFFESLSFEYIAAVFGVMACARRHTFQVLTKRPERAAEFFEWYEGTSGAGASAYASIVHAHDTIQDLGEAARASAIGRTFDAMAKDPPSWPLRNVWLGVSAEDQRTTDVRVPQLLGLPAALHWVSYEPAIGPVDYTSLPANLATKDRGTPTWDYFDALAGRAVDPQRGGHEDEEYPSLDWIVIGGESGAGARPFDLDWCRDTIAACKDAGVAVFAKQKGANAEDRGVAVHFEDSKGGDWGEWPEDLRVREYPVAA